MDSYVYLWKLYPDKVGGDDAIETSRAGLPIWKFEQKNYTFDCVTVYHPEPTETDKGSEPCVYATCTDKSIRKIKTITEKKDAQNNWKSKEVGRYEEGTRYNQVIMSSQGKFMAVGGSEAEKPAPIQVFRPNFDKAFEVQAHSKQINRLKLNFQNDRLFSVGDDGVLGIFTITDKEPKKPNQQQLPAITISDEILIQKKKRDTLQEEIRKLKADIKMHQDAHALNIANDLQQNNEKIEELTE